MARVCNFRRMKMDKGVPNCPDCGGKGMCDKHKIEYLKWEFEKAQGAYEDEIIKQREERIKQNEQGRNPS